MVNDMDALEIATLLGRTGEAVSPEGSWQQNLGAVAGETAASEQERRYLADLLGGAPDPTGRIGLDPGTVLEGLQLKQQIMESQPKTVQMSPVTLPTGEVVSVPANEVADFRRKVWAEQYTTDPSDIRTFQAIQEMPEETKKAFYTSVEKLGGPTVADSLAQTLLILDKKQRQRAETERDIEAKHELGTTDHYSAVKDSYDDMTLSTMYSDYSARVSKAGGTVPSPRTFREQIYLNEMAKDIEDQRDDVSNVRYERGPEGVGFYGTNKDGERILIQTFQSRT